MALSLCEEDGCDSRAPENIRLTAPQTLLLCFLFWITTSPISVISVVSRRSVDHIGTFRYCRERHHGGGSSGWVRPMRTAAKHTRERERERSAQCVRRTCRAATPDRTLVTHITASPAQPSACFRAIGKCTSPQVRATLAPTPTAGLNKHKGGVLVCWGAGGGGEERTYVRKQSEKRI